MEQAARTIGTVTLGAGRPKIIAPLMAASVPELLGELAAIEAAPVDLVEWRVDQLPSASDPEVLASALGELRRHRSKPLIATFRTGDEGGTPIDADSYQQIVTELCRSGLIDAIDIEYRHHRAISCFLEARMARVPVIASNHDFQGTPGFREILERLEAMAALGADVAKIAVMPHSPTDVLTVLAATNEAVKTASVPLITMAMGTLGRVTRLVGETFGSCATFAAVSGVSAPGQLDAGEVAHILDVLHDVS